MKLMFLCIEINLVLWLVALSGFAADDIDAQIKQIAWLTDSIPVPAAVPIIGLILSALIQHWAYYRLYKGRKDAAATTPAAAEVASRGSRT